MRTAALPRISRTVSRSSVFSLISVVNSLPLQPISAAGSHTHGLPASHSVAWTVSPFCNAMLSTTWPVGSSRPVFAPIVATQFITISAP